MTGALDLEEIDFTPDGSDSSDSFDGYTLDPVLDRLSVWFGRFIRVTDPVDLDLLTLWTAHTYVVNETYTTPRLQIDSTMPGSGKTTVLEHLERLAMNPVQAASVSSAALLARLIHQGVTTVLMDEVDRNLDPKREGVADLLAIINSGYKRGGTRPVLAPSKGGDWEPVKMSTYSPIVMAGNAPMLPDDTRSRCIRVLLMPDLDGTAEDSDWEYIDAEARELGMELARVMDLHRELVAASRPALPAGIRGRMAEKWRPLARVAAVAGGRWPEIVSDLAQRDLDEVEMEKEHGMTRPATEVDLLRDLYEVWPDGETFVRTLDLVSMLQAHAPDRWGINSTLGKPLTAQRMGRMLTRGFKLGTKTPVDMQVRSGKNEKDQRGYFRNALDPVWRRMHITVT